MFATLARTLAGVGAAVILTSAPALAGTNPPQFSISVTPAAVQGAAYSSAEFQYKDSGHTPITLNMQAVEETQVKGQPDQWVLWGEFDHARVTPERFTLQPGQTQIVKVVVNSSDGYQHRLSITAEVVQTGTSGQAKVVPAVGARYVVEGKGVPPYLTQAAPAKQLPTTTSGQSATSGQFPYEYLGFGAAGLGAVYLAWRLRKVRIHVTH